jgi:hypothetical protein
MAWTSFLRTPTNYCAASTAVHSIVPFKIFWHTTALVLYCILKKEQLKIVKIEITVRECKLSCVKKNGYYDNIHIKGLILKNLVFI